jgi:hypothetical protein
MSVCAFIKSDGSRCRALAMQDSRWCYGHAPHLANARSENGRRGGKRGGRGRRSELTDIKSQLKELVTQVRSGETDKGDAAVCAQLLGVHLRALEVERKIRETEELEQRLLTLEDQVSEKRR